MKYINQYEFRHVHYETNVLHGGRPPEKQNVASCGCGLCSCCMVVDALTDKALTVEECVELSCSSLANHTFGTDLNILGPVVAKKFELAYTNTADLDTVKRHLQAGGQVVARMKKGLFTNGSHYILLTAFDGKDFCILDPSYKIDKFDTPERVGRVDTANAPYLYCPAETVHAETEDDFTKYHLFSRKR